MSVTCLQCDEPIADRANFCAICGSPRTPVEPDPDATAVFPDASGGTPPELPERYRIVRFLGRGGMGRVYLCMDTDLEVDVAVKVLPPELEDHPQALEAIAKEARLAARLRAIPGILQLYEFERLPEGCLLVMEYAAEGSLHRRIVNHGPLPEDVCRRMGAEMATALGRAHEKKVLHRDIKPANILLTDRDEVRVADFGLARLLAETASTISMGKMSGTPAYVPPEVLRREAVDERSDLYSLGCVLFEMATKRNAFSGSFSEMALLKSSKHAEPPDPREFNPDLSHDFATIVRCLMASRPDERYPDAAACAAALREGGGRHAPPRKRSLLLAASGVQPAVEGLPPPPPSEVAFDLPEGCVRERGRLVWAKDGSEMVLVPGGPFLMGDEDGSDDERPAHMVELGPFLMDRHEVTVGQFRRFCETTDREMPSQPECANDRHPVVHVSWGAARAYAEWSGRALPTEAQWEKAARGTDGRQFPWGDGDPTAALAAYRDPGVHGTTSVAAHLDGSSPYGCLDMIGNAWEWCADWYAADYYGRSPAKDPIGPVEGSSRVLRGGAWNDPVKRLGCSRRRRSRPDARYDFIGFRCVVEL
ncbi:MAG: SUMF1/EgtB/PvdO family nonheme iron enzyme [Planctomycetota bacterium]|jgi:serine/threonine-protein kinase